MTRYKIWRLEMTGRIDTYLADANDWAQLINNEQYSGGAILRMEAIGTTDPPMNYSAGEFDLDAG